MTTTSATVSSQLEIGLSAYPAVRIRSSRHYFCFQGYAAVRCMVGCLLALLKKKIVFGHLCNYKQEQRKLQNVKFNKRG
jgi:hypothetical protein